MTMRRGGKPLPKDWHKTRARILARDPMCQECGVRPSRDVDHVEASGPDTDDNLQGLCRPCHLTKSAREGARARNKQREKGKRQVEAHPGLS